MRASEGSWGAAYGVLVAVSVSALAVHLAWFLAARACGEPSPPDGQRGEPVPGGRQATVPNPAFEVQDNEQETRTMTARSSKTRATRTGTMAADRQCCYVSPTGRACRAVNTLRSAHCTKHSCTTPGCLELKSSAQAHCDRHRAWASSLPAPQLDAGGVCLAPVPVAPGAEHASLTPAPGSSDGLSKPACATTTGWWSASPEAESIYAQCGFDHASADYATIDNYDTVEYATSGIPSPNRPSGIKKRNQRKGSVYDSFGEREAPASSGVPAAKAISIVGHALCRGHELPAQAVRDFREHQRRAMAILGDDPARCQSAWRKLVQTDFNCLDALGATCAQAQSRMRSKSELRQPVSGCPSIVLDDPTAPSHRDWMTAKFKAKKPTITAGLATLRRVCGQQVKIRRGPSKSRQRAEQK